MKKKTYLLTGFAMIMASMHLLAQTPKRLTEATISYDIVINTTSAKPQGADLLDGATSVIYLKGNSSRSEMVSSLASFTTIHDARTGAAVVLQEVSGQKLLIRMTGDNWNEKNKRYDGITFTSTSESKQIAGYNCLKTIATLKDGTSFAVFYTKELLADNQDYSYQFKTLDGLPLEYELIQGSLKIKYTVSKISLNPVPASRFDIPKSGYREMTYDESRKLGGGK